MANQLTRRRHSENTFAGLIASGKAVPVPPTTHTGFTQYGSGLLCLPEGTNYCTNPSFETWTGGASALPDSLSMNETITGIPTYSRVAGRTGGYALRVQHTGLAESGKSMELWCSTGDSSFAAGESCTLSGYYKVNTSGLSGCGLKLQAFTNGLGANLGSSSSVMLSNCDSWTRFSVTYNSLPATTGVIVARLFTISGIDEGDTIDITIDDVLIEKTSVLTPYFSGPQTWDSMSGCAWSGTANASTSTRAVSALYYPSPWTTVPTAGTIIARLVPLAANTSYGSEEVAGLYSTTTLVAGLTHKSGKLNTKVTAESTSAATFASGSVNCAVGRWNAAGTYLHFNGTAATDGAAPTVGGAIDRLYIGRTAVEYIGPVAFTSTCITAAQAVIADTLVRNGATGLQLFNALKDMGCADLYVYPLASDSVCYMKAS